MGVTDTYAKRAVEELFVDRTKRQRQDIFDAEGNFNNQDGLVESIAARGVLSPILCTKGGQIVFGERRWEASKLAGLLAVPVRYVEDIPPLELRIIELEENTRRKDLHWRDRMIAVSELHQVYSDLNGEGWSQTHTARTLNMDQGNVNKMLRVYEDRANPKISTATSYQQAYNTLYRQDERAAADLMEDISESAFGVVAGHNGETDALGTSVAGDGAGGYGDTGLDTDGRPRPVLGRTGQFTPPASPILNESFLTWASTYAGPRFNLVHCDYPYGSARGPQMNEAGNVNVNPYEDNEELYYALIEALCNNLDRLMSASAHLVFWLNADHRVHVRTREHFRNFAPSLSFWERPLIWHKTDNISVIADAQRLPRYSYETALVGVREDRKIIKAVANAYGAPTDKKWHPSTKPEPVLRHFFQMFCDANTRLLDPTCGGGSALRAAETLGAEVVLGLEVNEEHFRNGMTAMKQFRTLRAIAS